MQPDQFSLPLRPKLAEKDFQKISSYIQTNFGIKLPLSKLILVESRLIKRVLKLNITNFSEYVSYVFSNDGIKEQLELIDFICTNKTDFFREDHHFSFLKNRVSSLDTHQKLRIWSSACSSGEEPYTIAMVLEELKCKRPGINYEILATDISSAILQKAQRGEYPPDRMVTIPDEMRKRYFDQNKNGATVAEILKRSVCFEKFNLIDDSGYRKISRSFDMIFCRNVLIYFDPATQAKVVSNLISTLAPGGFLFLGHSETLLGRNVNLQQVQPTIYQKSHA